MERFRLFASSSETECRGERSALAELVHGDPLLRRFFTIFAVEQPRAADSALPRSRSAALDECDVFVGIFGETYGNAAGSVSPMEEEFDRATAGGKMRLIFVKGGDDANRDPRMTALIRKARQSVVCATFTDARSFRAEVHETLVDYLADGGKIRIPRLDEEVCEKASLDDLGEEPFRAFSTRARISTLRRRGDTSEIGEVLRHLHLGDEGRLTNAAVLLFGACPRNFFPSAVIECVEFRGVHDTAPIAGTSLVEEPVFGAIDRATDFVMRRLDSRTGSRTHDRGAPRHPEIPSAVVSEAIVNALAHRDYASRSGVRINVFRDRVEVTNPGRPAPLLMMFGLARSHCAWPRNNLIASTLRRTPYMEEVGGGTLRMIDGCRRARLPDPKFTVTSGFSVELSRRESGDGSQRWGEDVGGTHGRIDRNLGTFPGGIEMRGA